MRNNLNKLLTENDCSNQIFLVKFIYEIGCHLPKSFPNKKTLQTPKTNLNKGQNATCMDKNLRCIPTSLISCKHSICWKTFEAISIQFVERGRKKRSVTDREGVVVPICRNQFNYSCL